MGPKVHRFEEAFKQYIGYRHALAVNSCTAGLHLALDVIGIRPDDEVITTPMTFAAMANVVRRGARSVFLGVEQDTMNTDPARIKEAMTPRTRAIIPVHVAGHPCDMDAILDIARRHNLVVIEDAVHAAEAWYKGRRCNIGTGIQFVPLHLHSYCRRAFGYKPGDFPETE